MGDPNNPNDLYALEQASRAAQRAKDEGDKHKASIAFAKLGEIAVKPFEPNQQPQIPEPQTPQTRPVQSETTPTPLVQKSSQPRKAA